MRKIMGLSVVMLILLLLFGIAFPLLLIFSREAADFALSTLRFLLGSTPNAWVSTEIEKAMDVTYAAALAVFSVTAIFYMFFLEQSSARHRGFLRRELLFFEPRAMFVYQLAVAVLIGVLLLFDRRRNLSFLLYALSFHLTVSFYIVAVILFYTRKKQLDHIILIKLDLLLNRMDKKDPRVSSDAFERANEFLWKVAFDAGGQYSRGEYQEMGDLFHKLLKHLVQSLLHGSQVLDNWSPTKAYRLANSITRALVSGYECKGKADGLPGVLCDVDIRRLVMLLSEYTILVVNLSDANDEIKPPRDSKPDNQLAFLAGVACAAVDALGETGIRLYLDDLSVRLRCPYHDIRPSLLSRLLMALYARGYFLVVNNQPNSQIEKPSWIIRSIRDFQPVFCDFYEQDIYGLWQVWNETEGALPYSNYRDINRLANSLQSLYTMGYQEEYPEADDVIYLLLFGQ